MYKTTSTSFMIIFCYQAWAILSVSGAGPYSIVAKISDTVGISILKKTEKYLFLKICK